MRKFILSPLALIYATALRIRSSLYDWRLLRVQRLPGAVISVGNIVAGGSGKTPYVIAVAEYLIARGERVAILTRGYKSRLGPRQFVVLRDGRCVFGNVCLDDLGADEAMMQSSVLPAATVIVGRKRLAATKQYLQHIDELHKPTIFILDDGFQHRQIFRDLDVVLIKGGVGLGNGALLPAGPLREGAGALRRADLVVGTRCSSWDEARSLLPPGIDVPVEAAPVASVIAPLNESAHTADLSQLPRIAVMTAIANPELFIQDLKNLGLEPQYRLCMPDHQRFSARQLSEVCAKADALFITEKDLNRQIRDFQAVPLPIYTLVQRYQLGRAIAEALERIRSR